MILFIIGLILGAILSVIADRLWRQYERRPKLDISCGEFLDRTIGGIDEGYDFTITNRGDVEIPPYKIWIYNPSHGSISFFVRDREGSTLPGQKLVHRFIMIRNQKLLAVFPDLYRDRNSNPMNNAQKDKFVFRLISEKSDKKIYENENIGSAFVKVFQNTRENGSFSKNTYDDMKALQIKYEPFYGKLLGKIQSKICKKGN